MITFDFDSTREINLFFSLDPLSNKKYKQTARVIDVPDTQKKNKEISFRFKTFAVDYQFLA